MARKEKGSHQPIEEIKNEIPPTSIPAYQPSKADRRTELLDKLESMLERAVNSGVNIDMNTPLKEMAMHIAVGIYQSPKMLEMAEDAKEQALKDGEHRSIMQYVAIMSLETASWIEKYAKEWK